MYVTIKHLKNNGHLKKWQLLLIYSHDKKEAILRVQDF